MNAKFHVNVERSAFGYADADLRAAKTQPYQTHKTQLHI